MKRFAITLVALAFLPAVGQAAQPDSENAAAERQIREKLNQPAEIEFVVDTLANVVQNLKNQLKIDIRLDLPCSRKWASTNRRLIRFPAEHAPTCR